MEFLRGIIIMYSHNVAFELDVQYISVDKNV